MKSVASEAATDLKAYGLDKPTTTVTVGLGSALAGLAIGKKRTAAIFTRRDVSKSQVVTVAADLLTDLQGRHRNTLSQRHLRVQVLITSLASK